MTLRLQLIVAVAVIVALFYIGNLVRIRRLELKYALIWFLVGVLLLIFDLAPIFWVLPCPSTCFFSLASPLF